MKVFISWSGVRSKALAQALREWLPLVLQYVQPWVSENDITAGERWAQSVGTELEAANFGIICITPENLSSEWVLFEAGALSKSMQDAKVIPLLFDLELSDIAGPLAQFQAKKLDQAGVSEVVQAINGAAGNQTSPDIVNQLVPALWPKLAGKLEAMPPRSSSERHTRSQKDILEELVASIRSIDARTRDVDAEPTQRRNATSRRDALHYLNLLLMELEALGLNEPKDPVSLLVLAGFIREDLPWLAEVIVEGYRDIKNRGFGEVDMVYYRLQRVSRLLREPLFRESFRHVSPDLPSLIDVALFNGGKKRATTGEKTVRSGT